MPTHEPSLKSINTPLNVETNKLSSCSLWVLVIGALSQVETTIELTNRVYDRYMALQTRPTFDRALPSGTKPAFP
jgi:hypothetical protein